MIRTLTTLAFLLALTIGAAAECGPTNPNCVVPTAPPGTSDSRAASTAFVMKNAGGRTRLTAPLDLYADYVNGSDANPCITGAPCKTAQHTYNMMVSSYDTAGQNVGIHLLNNDPTCFNVVTAWTGGGNVVITGPGSSSTQPTVGFVGCTGNGVTIQGNLPGLLGLFNLVLTSSSGGVSLLHQGIGDVVLSNVVFGAAAAAHMEAIGTGAKITCTQPAIITMTAQATVWAAGIINGNFVCQSATFVFLGSQAYTFVAYAGALGSVVVNGSVFCSNYSLTTCNPVTAVTGQKFLATTNGLIDTETGNLNFIPGTPNSGQFINGGQYN
jgi:hypothetical protein